MPAELTPMMRQYMEVKEKYKDCILFYRLGDFYEMFFEDALLASKELEIVLTGRDCGLEERAPMCGVPYHAVEMYASKLVEKGYRVAICEQLTDPKEAKGIVERDVVRVITPGTVIEESMLSEEKNNYIASVFLRDCDLGLAYCDVSTGVFYVYEYSGKDYQNELFDELCRIRPTEVVTNDAVFLNEPLAKRLQSEYYARCYGNWAYEYTGAEQRLLTHFGVATLSGFGCSDMPCAIAAAGALLAYLEDTQKNSLCHIRRIRVVQRSKYMHIDANSRRNLELTEPLRSDGSKKNTLLYLLNKTGTAMGSRLLRSWLELPLQDPNEIDVRLDTIDELLNAPIQRRQLTDALGDIYDIERLCSRIAYSTVHARDCDCLRRSLEKLPSIISMLEGFKSGELKRIHEALDGMEDICRLLTSAVMENPPTSIRDGGIIRDGYNDKLDEYRDAARNGKNWLARLEAQERENTGIKNLRIGYNRVFGYYIEVSKSYRDMVPYVYQRRQTLANSERYVTDELKELESTILGAEENSITLEYQLFCELRETLMNCIERLQSNAALIAALDVYCSMAQVAFENNYCRPKIVTGGRIEITDGRHPVVEKNVSDGFVPNNTMMNAKDDRLLILTGPNMAGKSTYMRQVALIVLMAHIGSFVPASAATITITDKIFTRVGASDSLASGQSTFMVEMSEMSNILNNATQNSLLIIDEIGRGTSTFDGLSIAWAVIEYIADRERCGARTIFATHYHELTELEGKMQGIKNYRISVKEVGEDIIFLRKIVRGGADKSFGIQVARLAGLPHDVIKRAREILHELENSDISIDRGSTLKKAEADAPQQITLFGSSSSNDIVQELKDVDVNTITPMEALNMIYDLHLRAKLQ